MLSRRFFPRKKTLSEASSVVPRGHTQPQNTLPSRMVIPTMMSESAIAGMKARAASMAAPATKGSSLANRSTGTPGLSG